MLKTLKLTSYCAVIIFGIWLVGAIWADTRERDVDPVWEVDVTVRLDAIDCNPGEGSASENMGIPLDYYPDCCGRSAAASGARDNASKTLGASPPKINQP